MPEIPEFFRCALQLDERLDMEMAGDKDMADVGVAEGSNGFVLSLAVCGDVEFEALGEETVVLLDYDNAEGFLGGLCHGVHTGNLA